MSAVALIVPCKHYLYLDVIYYLRKHVLISDMAAIPDFSAGAMENWGLILYRETAMLYDANISSTSNKQRIATVVSHELAHQVRHRSVLSYKLTLQIRGGTPFRLVGIDKNWKRTNDTYCNIVLL